MTRFSLAQVRMDWRQQHSRGAIGIVARLFGEPMEFWRQMSKGTFCDLPRTPATSPTQLGAFPLKDFVAEP